MKFNFLKPKSTTKLVLAVTALSIFAASCGGDKSKNENEDESNQQQEQVEIDLDNLTESDLKKFLDIDNEIMPLQRMADSEMIGIIERNGLTIEEYSSIAQAAQNPLEEPEIENEKMEMFEFINDSLGMVQDRMMAKYEEVITKHGIVLEDYIAMVNKINSDQDLQRRLTEMMNQGQENMLPEDFMLPEED